MKPWIRAGEYAGKPSFVLTPSDHVDAKALAAGVAETASVPSWAGTVVFSATGNFYVKWYGGAAAVPGDVSDGSASELNPAARCVIGITQFSVIAPADCVVTMSYFQ